MIPEFNTYGCLPEGVHEATFAEIRVKFGTNPHREGLLDQMESLLANLAGAGCTRFFLDGSFVTAKELPEDYDALLGYEGLNQSLLDPIILQTPNAGLVKEKYGCDLMPCDIKGHSGKFWLDYFTTDKESGQPKGIIKVIFDGGLK